MGNILDDSSRPTATTRVYRWVAWAMLVIQLGCIVYHVAMPKEVTRQVSDVIGAPITSAHDDVGFFDMPLPFIMTWLGIALWFVVLALLTFTLQGRLAKRSHPSDLMNVVVLLFCTLVSVYLFPPILG